VADVTGACSWLAALQTLLQAAINRYLGERNRIPKPFV